MFPSVLLASLVIPPVQTLPEHFASIITQFYPTHQTSVLFVLDDNSKESKQMCRHFQKQLASKYHSIHVLEREYIDIRQYFIESNAEYLITVTSNLVLYHDMIRRLTTRGLPLVGCHINGNKHEGLLDITGFFRQEQLDLSGGVGCITRQACIDAGDKRLCDTELNLYLDCSMRMKAGD